MKQSIIQPEADRCFICGSRCNLERHHAMHGTANRKLAEAYGLTVMLCHEHHNTPLGVHQDIILDERIKKAAQKAFQDIYGRAMWMRLFRKNYL